MKLNINKNLKITLISIITISILLTIYLIYNKVYNPGFEEQKNPVYSYINKGSINYSVYLKPNNLYTGKIMDEGKLYITEFVDYLDTNLKYEFTGDRAADINGKYNVIAKIQGFIGEGEKLINIWDKNFTLIPYKSINSNNGKVSINENIKLNINDYNAFVKEIKESSKINCNTTLTLSINVDLTGLTDKGPVKESISPNLIIPLDVSMFEITGNSIIDQPGTIEETIQVQLPVDKKQVIIYGIIMFILVTALTILIFFTQLAPIKDPMEKELKKIFKKHGDRLVALNTDIIIEDSIIVKSIEDLIKIADEKGKPILYKYSDNYKKINKFYVSNDDEIFLFKLEYADIYEQTEDSGNSIPNNISEQIKSKI
nr:DUF5305 domain-containing protein [Sedimentibacter sp.]